MILNQQLNCNKMIKEIKVTSQRSPISDILHVFLENIFPRKHHLGIERPWAEWKKSLWKAISISPTSLHRILTSCQNWKQPFISQQQGKANVCWWKRVFSFSFSQNSSFTNLSDLESQSTGYSQKSTTQHVLQTFAVHDVNFNHIQSFDWQRLLS